MARLRADGFDGVQVTSGEPPSPGVMPFCGLDRINSPQESLPIATKYADTAKVQVTRTVKRLHGRVTRSILILPSVMGGRFSFRNHRFAFHALAFWRVRYAFAAFRARRPAEFPEARSGV
jgi:hypothetical protein